MSEEKKVDDSNTIHGDAIWRQRVKTELKNAEEWYNVWGFVKDLYPKSLSKPEILAKHTPKQEIVADPFKSGLPSKLPNGLSDKNDLMSDLLLTHQTRRLMIQKFPFEKYSYPCTTSQDLGWPWNENQKPGDRLKLEPFGREARGKMDVKKIFDHRYLPK